MSWARRHAATCGEVVYLELDIPLKDLIKAASWPFYSLFKLLNQADKYCNEVR